MVVCKRYVDGMLITDAHLATMDVSELGELTRQAARALAGRQSLQALSELTACLSDLGQAMGAASWSGWSTRQAWTWTPIPETPAAHGSRTEHAMTLYGITEA